jgi:hypothetical protein
MLRPSLPARRRDWLRRLIVDVEPLRRDRDFRLLWIGQVVSGLGRQVTALASRAPEPVPGLTPAP